jgi:hypothetical protein
MHRKLQSYYIHVLFALKKEATQQKLKLDPRYIMTDFETAAINAFKIAFVGIENK